MTARLVTYPAWWQDTLHTDDAAWHTIATIPVPSTHTVALRVVVAAHSTDLYVDDGLAAFGEGGWTDAAATATALGSNINKYTSTIWDVQFTQSGSNILVQVKGDAYVNVAWMIRWAVDQVQTV